MRIFARALILSLLVVVSFVPVLAGGRHLGWRFDAVSDATPAVFYGLVPDRLR